MSKSQFGHLKQLEVNETSTSRYYLRDLEGCPCLLVKPATEGNKDYLNRLLALNAKQASVNGQRQKPKQRAKTSVDAADLQQVREADRDNFPGVVIYGWEDVVNNKGEQVEFTEEVCRDYIGCLPDWIFDGVRNYVVKPTNFIENVVEDSEDAAKN